MANPMYGQNGKDDIINYISSSKCKTVVRGYQVHTKDGSENQLDVMPTNCIIQKVWLEVLTAESTGSTKTIDIGLNGGGLGVNDPDGLADALATNATGIIETAAVATATLGALHYGADQAGSNLGNGGGVMCGGDKLTYTLGSAHTELVANVWVQYTTWEVDAKNDGVQS